MVHENTVFIREEAKLARNTHLYTFSTGAERTTPLAAEIICSRDYNVTLGGVAHKSCYLRGDESFLFSQKGLSPELVHT